MKQIKEVQRMLGKKTMEVELLRRPLYRPAKQVDSARTIVTRGWRISFVSRCLRVSRAQLHAITHRPADWQDRRRKRQPDDTEVLNRIHAVTGEVPTYGYRRVWAVLVEGYSYCCRCLPQRLHITGSHPVACAYLAFPAT